MTAPAALTPTPPPEPLPPARRRWSRRRFLVAGTAATVAAGAGTTAVAVGRAASQPDASRAVVAFHGSHQAGIITPPPSRLHLAAFDLTTERRPELVELLRAWTAAAADLTRGREVGTSGATGGAYLAPPDDTGEALDLGPSRLTITVGFGPSLFGAVGADAERYGPDRFGLAARRPAALQPLPHFAGDGLDPARSGGDLCLQVCADDAQVALHAVRNLARIGFGVATPDGRSWASARRPA